MDNLIETKIISLAEGKSYSDDYQWRNLGGKVSLGRKTVYYKCKIHSWYFLNFYDVCDVILYLLAQQSADLSLRTMTIILLWNILIVMGMSQL